MISRSCESNGSDQRSTGLKERMTKSTCTNCSSSSSSFFKHRKSLNSLTHNSLSSHTKNNYKTATTTPSKVKQRVMSAAMLKLRQLQNQLSDAHYHLAELARENKTLKTLQKRQDVVLKKYENTNGELPRLIHSHEEEVRALTESNKKLRETIRSLSSQLKQKESELLRVKERLGRLEKLEKDKHLMERAKLMDLLDDYKIKLGKCEEQLVVLNRKLTLESKISKQRLNTEMAKHRQAQKEFMKAMEEISVLTSLLEEKGNTVRPRNYKFVRDPLNSRKTDDRRKTLDSQVPVTKVQIQPLFHGNSDEKSSIITAPIDAIRQRLSNNETAPPLTSVIDTQPASSGLQYLKQRPNSSVRLEKLAENGKHSKQKNGALNSADQLNPSLESDVNITTSSVTNHSSNVIRALPAVERTKDVIPSSVINDEGYNEEKSSSESPSDIFNSSDENDEKIAIDDKKFGIREYGGHLDKNELLRRSFSNSDDSSEALNVMVSKENSEMLSHESANALQELESRESDLIKSFFSMDNHVNLVKDILADNTASVPTEANNEFLGSDHLSGFKTNSIKFDKTFDKKKKLLATLKAIDNGDNVGISFEEAKLPEVQESKDKSYDSIFKF